jgi:hypothetical protein
MSIGNPRIRLFLLPLLWTLLLFSGGISGDKTHRPYEDTDCGKLSREEIKKLPVLKNPFNAVLLFHSKANFPCGFIATADFCAVKSDAGDTMAFAVLCGLDASISKGDSVLVVPDKKPSAGVTLGNGSVSRFYPSFCKKVRFARLEKK